MCVTGLHDLPLKKLDDHTNFFVTRIYRKKKLHNLQHTLFFCLMKCEVLSGGLFFSIFFSPCLPGDMPHDNGSPQQLGDKAGTGRRHIDATPDNAVDHTTIAPTIATMGAAPAGSQTTGLPMNTAQGCRHPPTGPNSAVAAPAGVHFTNSLAEGTTLSTTAGKTNT